MNKITILSVLLFSLCGPMFAGEQAVYNRLAEELSRDCGGTNKKIFIGFFPYSSGKDSHDSDIISEKIAAAMDKLVGIGTVSKEVRADVLSRMKIQRRGIVEERVIRKMGKMAGADCVVMGNLAAPNNELIELNARAVSVKSGKVLSVSWGILTRDWDRQYWDNIHSLHRLEKSSPPVASLFYERGKYYLDVEGGRYVDAVTDFSRALSIDESHWEAALARGYAYDVSYDYKKARADYARAAEINGEGLDVKYLLGMLSREEGRLEESVGYFADVVKAAPNDPLPYKQRAFSWMYAKQFDKAIEDFTRSIVLAPGQAGAYASRGQVYALKGNYDSAIADTEEALKVNPSLHQTYLTRGFAYSKLGESDKYEKSYAEAIRLWPAVLNDGFYGKTKEEEKSLLIQVLKNYDVGRNACEALLDRLAQYGGDEAVADAFTEVYKKSGPSRRIEILGAFRKLRSPGSLSFLSELLADDDVSVRLNAVFAIWRIGGDRAKQILSKALSDNSPDVRKLAIGSLGVLRDEGHLAEIARVAKREKDPEIKWLARQTAEKIQVEKAKRESKQLAEIDLWDLVDNIVWRGPRYEQVVGKMKSLPKEDWPGFIRKIDDFLAAFPSKKGDESWEALMFIMPHFIAPFESDPVLIGNLLGDMAADKSYGVVFRKMDMDHAKAEILQRIADDSEEYPVIRAAAQESLRGKNVK